MFVRLSVFQRQLQTIAVDLSKQKALDPREIQQIVFQGALGGVADGTKIRLYIILEKSKQTVLEFYKEQQKFCE